MILASFTVALALSSTVHLHTDAVSTVGMTVADLDRSVEFYTKVLKFEKVSESELWGDEYEQLEGVFGLRMRRAKLRLGDEYIELTEFLAPQGRSIPPDSRSNDRWFQHIAIIVSDMDRAYAWLHENRVRQVSPSPQLLPEWNKNAAGIRAFYFRDPDGHSLEILQFPNDKGDAKWHVSNGNLFLGIDHTAIVVGDTEASLGFYRNLLGFRIAGESENYGIEQERLNNVFGAHLKITSLRAVKGPGIELLEYLTPSGGRPIPADERPDDVTHWQTRVILPEPGACAVLLNLRVPFLSSGRIGKECLVRDPDGHVLDVAER